MLEIIAQVKGISYIPLLCKSLTTYDFKDLETALNESAFLLNVNKNQVAISWWVTPKRTRSYPYQRVYDTLSFSGKKITIIPILKDEGKDGERDYLQWDTISLMSLLGIYVIIAYYSDAKKNPKYDNKITGQSPCVDILCTLKESNKSR